MASLGYIDTFIAEIDKATNLEEIHVAVRRHIEFLGFDVFSYQLIWPPEGRRFPVYITNYPSAWTKRYIEENHIRHDFVTRAVATTSRPFLWTDIPNLRKITDRQKIVFHEAGEFKLKTGGTVPIHGPGHAKALFAVANYEMSDAEFQKLFLLRRHELHLIATYAHERLLAVGLQNPPLATMRLTPRETEILTYTANGKTIWEISEVLNLSENTVKQHVKSVCGKLGVYNKVHATAVAMIHGLISL